MSEETTRLLIEGLQVAAQAKANPPDPHESAEAFAQIITAQLQKGN